MQVFSYELTQNSGSPAKFRVCDLKINKNNTFVKNEAKIWRFKELLLSLRS